MESPTRFVKVVTGDTTHAILKNPSAGDVKIVVERMETIYPDRTIDVDYATRCEWAEWHGLRVLQGGKET